MTDQEPTAVSVAPGALEVSGDPLPAQEALTGRSIGYGRAIASGQHLEHQRTVLEAAGCAAVFLEVGSVREAARPELDAARHHLRPGDALVVTSLPKLSGSLTDLVALVADLQRQQVGFRSLREALDTTTPDGRVVFHVFTSLAGFARDLVVDSTHEGLHAARGRGVRLGRPPAMTPDQVRDARRLLAERGTTVVSVARLFGVSRSTLYRHLSESGAGERRDAVQPASPGPTRTSSRLRAPDRMKHADAASRGTGPVVDLE